MKQTRQAAILSIIQRKSIQTQEELLAALEEEGFHVTQATVSRDIRDMALQKTAASDGKYRYVSGRTSSSFSDRFIRLYRDSVLSVDWAQNIIVVKTLPGSANAAAEAIDGMNFPEALGTMAGDNTMFLVVHSAEEARDVSERLRALQQ